jgi:tRNA nucleotidyltransferase (CCA-adding enzyme)
MSLVEAARRRDFTINAISWDPLTGSYEDPFDGRGDLDRRLLRAVDSRTFSDDSLRAAARGAVRRPFEFALEEQTAVLCRALSLDDLPAERIWAKSKSSFCRRRVPRSVSSSRSISASSAR